MLIEILVHVSGVLSNTAELRANIAIYEIAGVLHFYILSAYLFDARIINERLKNASARSLNIRALAWRWIWPFFCTVLLAMTILFLLGINRGENIHLLSGGASVNYIKYGAGFYLLAVTLTGYAVLPMAFKGAAYAHYLVQKAKT